MEFKNKEYQELSEKNNQLTKENYISNMTLQRNEEKMKLILDNFNDSKEKNKKIFQDLEKKIKEKKIKKKRRKKEKKEKLVRQSKNQMRLKKKKKI